MRKDRFPLISTIIAAVLVLCIAALGAWCHLRENCLSTFVTLLYLVLPGGVFVGMFFVLRTRMRKPLRILICFGILIILVLALIVVWLFFGIISGSSDGLVPAEGEDALERFGEEVNTDVFTLDDLGEPEQLEYYNYTFNLLFFLSESNYLICQYAPEDYIAQKETLSETYVFQTELLTDIQYSAEPTLTIEDYEFAFLSCSAYDLTYPKELAWIGCNDETCEIVYFHYYDADLDYIDDVESFFLEDCGWERIR